MNQTKPFAPRGRSDSEPISARIQKPIRLIVPAHLLAKRPDVTAACLTVLMVTGNLGVRCLQLAPACALLSHVFLFYFIFLSVSGWDAPLPTRRRNPSRHWLGHSTATTAKFHCLGSHSVPERVPVSPRLGYWTKSDQASESCTGKVLYYYVYFWRVNQRSFRQLDYTI